MARSNSFEGSSDETTVTTGNSGGGSGNAFDSAVIGTSATVVYDNAQAALGSYSCRTATAGTSALAYVGWNLAAVASDYARAYYRLTSLPPAQQAILRYLSSGSQSLRVNVKTDGAIEIRNAANSVVATTSATVSAGAWFRVEIHPVFSTTVGTIELRLYLTPNGSSPTETLTPSGLVLTASASEIRYGVGAAMTNAVALWVDNVATEGGTWFGPALVTGTADRATTFGTVAVGGRTVLGTAARETTAGTSAAGSRTVLGVAARAITVATETAGTRTVFGGADRAGEFAAVANGTRQVGGTADRVTAFAAPAVGSRQVYGQAASVITFVAPAVGGVLVEHDPTATLVASVTAATLTATASQATLAASATAATLVATG